MDAFPGTLESYFYSSIKDVHGTLEEPYGALLAHSGAPKVPTGALEAHPDNSEADSGVCVGTSTAIMCLHHNKASLHASRVSLHSSRVILYI